MGKKKKKKKREKRRQDAFQYVQVFFLLLLFIFTEKLSLVLIYQTVRELKILENAPDI